MAIKSRAMMAAGLMVLMCLPCLPTLAQGGFVPSVPIVKGSANNQLARWDVATGKWIPVTGASLDSTGHLVAASVTAGGNLLAPYTLPTASGSVLGAIKVGSGLSIDGGGVLSNTYSFALTGAGIISALGYTPGTGNGTVTSVGLSTPNLLYTVSGSPVTGSGTLTETLKTQTANTVLAGPSSGAAAAPTFRGLVSADLPVSPSITGTTLISPSSSGDGVDIVLPGTNTSSNAALSIQNTASLVTGSSAYNIKCFNTGSTVFSVDAGGNVKCGAIAPSSLTLSTLGIPTIGDPFHYVKQDGGGNLALSGSSNAVALNSKVTISGFQASAVGLSMTLASGQSANARQTLSSTLTPLEWAEANGSNHAPAFLSAVRTVSASTTLLSTDTTIITNGSPVAFASFTGLSGHSWTIINTGGSSLTCTLTGGSITQGSLTIGAGHNSTFLTDGTNLYQTAGI